VILPQLLKRYFVYIGGGGEVGRAMLAMVDSVYHAYRACTLYIAYNVG
jgi:hypothetical protein